MDKNGLDPEICTVHTNICIFFCNSCVTTFCSGCIANHFSHNFNWAYRKAKEILTNIHEKRAHFEGLSVHGNHERSVRLECENRITSLHRNLGEENIAEYLTNLFCDVIRSNIHRWSRAVDEKVGSCEFTNVTCFKIGIRNSMTMKKISVKLTAYRLEKGKHFLKKFTFTEELRRIIAQKAP